ncbi:hypothetical protein MNBD_GAMMA17-1354 [hydrothermal vent metagenome]|uniref:Molecular chaperone n=1 Tax=hydrothermal vent metagenome TaxID=652676 RepID=A0A3B0ZI76_9ZZZZ
MSNQPPMQTSNSETAPPQSGTSETSPDVIRRWIRALPLADQRATIQLTTAALRDLNNFNMTIGQRAHALALFSPLINTLIKRIAQYYEHSRLSFASNKREHFDNIQAMLDEAVNGYLIIINESPLPAPLRTHGGEQTRHNKRRVPAGSDTHYLCCALYQAIEHLSQRLLHSYLVYTTPSAEVWAEIHRLYYIAETYNIPATPFSFGSNNKASQGKALSIERSYKRILLFSLANPFHLMPHEMTRAYQSLRSWAQQCKIIRSDSPEKLQGRFYIDLESDQPPTHHSLNRLDLELPSLRLLDIAETLPSGKYQRALDKRLTHALIIRPERLTRRTKTDKEITIVNGLNASHHFINNESCTQHIIDSINPVNPIEVQTTSATNRPSTFSAQQKNSSLGGLALHYNEATQYLPTGALITYRPTQNTLNNGWNIGTVRWSRNNLDKGYELGIQCLAEDGAAVKSSMLEGENSPGELHPSLLTPNVDPLIHPTTLIAPVKQYHVGDKLKIHREESQFHIELTQLIETTWAYAHYRFNIIADQSH